VFSYCCSCLSGKSVSTRRANGQVTQAHQSLVTGLLNHRAITHTHCGSTQPTPELAAGPVTRLAPICPSIERDRGFFEHVNTRCPRASCLLTVEARAQPWHDWHFTRNIDRITPIDKMRGGYKTDLDRLDSYLGSRCADAPIAMGYSASSQAGPKAALSLRARASLGADDGTLTARWSDACPTG